MSEITIILPKLFEKQKDIKREAKRFNVICVGRRSGKTVLCVDLITDTILDKKKVSYFAPTYKMLKEVWKEVKNRLQPIITKISEQDKSIEFLTGGTIDFWSLDAFNSVRGRKYHRVIIDEASISPYLEEAWEQAIRPTLIDYLGDAFFFSTPKGANYFKVLFDKGKELDNWKVWQIATKDFNPKISLKELESFKDSMPSVVYRQELEAEFIDLQGSLLKREWIKYYNDIPDNLEIAMGVDLAISEKTTADYTAIVVSGIDKENNIYVLDVYRKQMSYNETINTIIRYANKWSPNKINIETVAYQSAMVQELKRLTNFHIKGITPKKDKVTRFLPLAGKFEQGLILLRKELPLYFENELLSFPDGSNDDCVDALVYSYEIKSQFQFR
jgi:predicted phage terminase large subunit-like protein